MSPKLDIIVENHIPFIRGVLEPVASVRYLAAEDITPEAMATADALLTRTRTRCDERLLSGSRCRFIGTATIGTDHIDLEYCRSRGITVANAPGCNAPAVAQYVLRAVLRSFPSPQGVKLGIVGVGHVGTIVDRWARSLGMTTLLNDPPRAAVEPEFPHVPLSCVAAEADVITFHTPLTKAGPYPTYHLFDDEFAARLRRKPMIINAARGGVTDTHSLIHAFDGGLISSLAIDCWEGEPTIDDELLRRAEVATPHIAGYSAAGKVRATQMVIDALAAYFGLPSMLAAVGDNPPHLAVPERVTVQDILRTYDIDADTAALKADTSDFEKLRNSYHLRPEPAEI